MAFDRASSAQASVLRVHDPIQCVEFRHIDVQGGLETLAGPGAGMNDEDEEARELITRLKQGYLLCVYVEGTRTETGELTPVEPGAALVIRRAGGNTAAG